MTTSQSLVNFPVYSTPFTGRLSELKEISANLLSDDCRLLTLAGPGGIGKTRLAIETASNIVEHFSDGAYFASLVNISSIDEVIVQLATTLNLSNSRYDASHFLDQLTECNILLLLDNFDDVISDATQFLDAILAQAPDVTLLVTSRELLRLRDEWVYQVPGLSSENPPDAEDFFAICAAHANQNFVLDDHINCVRSICKTIACMPLAIELVASWLNIISCTEIAGRIQSDFGLLTTDLRDFPERHRSFDLIFQQTMTALSASQRDMLCKLSVFRGGFSLDAAHNIADARLEDVRGFITKSLIRLEGEQRYHLHDLLRRYCQRVLDEHDPDHALGVRDKHCAYYASMLEMTCYPQLITGSISATINLIDDELENIWQAWDHAVAHNQSGPIMKMLGSLYFYYEAKGLQPFLYYNLTDLVDKLRNQDAAPQHDLLLARVLIYIMALQNTVNPARSLDTYHEARSLLEKVGAEMCIDAGLLETFAGEYCLLAGDYEHAQNHLRTAISICNNQDQIPDCVWFPLLLMGRVNYYLGRHELAMDWVNSALEYKTADDSYCAAHCSVLQCLIHIAAGNIEHSQTHLLHYLNSLLNGALPIPSIISWNMLALALLLQNMGQEQDALHIFMGLVEWQPAEPIVQRDARNFMGMLDHQATSLPDARQRAKQWTVNEREPEILMGLQPDLIEHLLRQLERAIAPAPTLSIPLSDRETSILCLILKGHSNQEIADELVVTIGTIKRHIHHIYNKLGVRNRVAAVKRAQALGLCHMAT